MPPAHATATVGKIVTGMQILQLGRESYKVRPDLMFFAFLIGLPAMVLGWIVGLVSGIIIQSLNQRSRLQPPDSTELPEP